LDFFEIRRVTEPNRLDNRSLSTGYKMFQVLIDIFVVLENRSRNVRTERRLFLINNEVVRHCIAFHKDEKVSYITTYVTDQNVKYKRTFNLVERCISYGIKDVSITLSRGKYEYQISHLQKARCTVKVCP